MHNNENDYGSREDDNGCCEDDYGCCCFNCINYLNQLENNEYKEYDEDDGSYLNSLHDKCKELVETFQLPSEYKQNVFLNFFYDDTLIEDYKNLSDPEYYVNSSFLIYWLRNQLEMIDREKNVKLKKARFLILLEFLNLKKIREFITSNNKSYDIISYKIKVILIDEQKDQDFVAFIKNNLTINI